MTLNKARGLRAPVMKLIIAPLKAPSFGWLCSDFCRLVFTKDQTPFPHFPLILILGNRGALPPGRRPGIPFFRRREAGTWPCWVAFWSLCLSLPWTAVCPRKDSQRSRATIGHLLFSLSTLSTQSRDFSKEGPPPPNLRMGCQPLDCGNQVPHELSAEAPNGCTAVPGN